MFFRWESKKDIVLENEFFILEDAARRTEGSGGYEFEGMNRPIGSVWSTR